MVIVRAARPCECHRVTRWAAAPSCPTEFSSLHFGTVVQDWLLIDIDVVVSDVIGSRGNPRDLPFPFVNTELSSLEARAVEQVWLTIDLVMREALIGIVDESAQE